MIINHYMYIFTFIGSDCISKTGVTDVIKDELLILIVH